MTLLERINKLNWVNHLANLKVILKELMNQGSGEGRPYKSYTALITQSGTSAPTAIVLENTIGAVTWEYLGVGKYQVTSNGLFTENKTFSMTKDENSAVENEHQAMISTVDTNTIYLESATSYVPTDGVLFNHDIEIRVYN